MNAAEIREKLVAEYSMDPKEVYCIKGITALRETLAEQEELEGVDDELQFEDTEEQVESLSSDELEMSLTNPNWTNYVMGEFVENELIEFNGEKRPTVHGLRRVAQLMFGTIIRSESKIVQSPTPQNDYCACVESTITFFDNSGYERVVSDVADVSPSNCEMTFARHSTSTAATKAEARALRKILQLNFISAEESTPDNLPDINLGKIEDVQIHALELVCKRYDINLIELANSGEQHYDNIKQMSSDAATTMLSIINDDAKRKDFLSNKEGLSGFDSNWRELFYNN